MQARSEFKRSLPEPWRQAVRGGFGITLDIGDGEMATRIRQELHELHRSQGA